MLNEALIRRRLEQNIQKPVQKSNGIIGQICRKLSKFRPESGQFSIFCPKLAPSGPGPNFLSIKEPSSFLQMRGSTPKSGFLGPGVDFGISPGTFKNAFWPPKKFLEPFWHPKMEQFWIKIGSGSEKRDFVKMLVSLRKNHDFQR